MGNCLFGGPADRQLPITVTTSNGGVMEFHSPITVESITDEFPSHGIFRSHDFLWPKPLPHTDLLLSGESYLLLPLSDADGYKTRIGHVRSNSAPPPAPYRMSFHGRGTGKRFRVPTDDEVVVGKLGAAGRGFWKVKLVISPEQLAEILGEEERAEELIESVRTVAKCGSGGFSDQWSLCSSRNAAFSTNKDNSWLEF